MTSHTCRGLHLSARRISLPIILILWFSSGCRSAAAPSATGIVPTATVRAAIEVQPVPGGPVILRDGISIRSVANVDAGSIKLALHPQTGDLYILNTTTGLRRMKMDGSYKVEKAANPQDIVEDGSLSGMAFGPDGTLYMAANRKVEDIYNQAIIRQGTADPQGVFQWKTLAQTEPYPLSNTPFDHMFNGMIVSLDGTELYINSGSRTDHGEVENNKGNFKDTREVALTAKIFQIPTDAEDLRLANDEDALKAQGFIFAWGTRNAYDMAFAPNGDLFATDNGPDADFPDELNWLQEGKHYGFPWRFGDQDNPQQFPDYTSIGDKRLSPDFTAVQIGAYRRDPDFPRAPGGFTSPVVNLGPDATHYRADDGSEHIAAEEGRTLHTFSPHRSPLGLVFSSEAMPKDFRGNENTYGAFILSWGAAGGTLTDRGEDLLFLQLTKRGDHYETTTTQIAREFQNPIDAVLIENRLYVLDFGTGIIWELTFE